MQLAAYLDERCVEMRIVTDTGKSIAIVYDRDGIFAIERHIDQVPSSRECLEIKFPPFLRSGNAASVIDVSLNRDLAQFSDSRQAPDGGDTVVG